MKSIDNAVLLGVLLFVFTKAGAQDKYVVRGRIVNAQTGQPVPFVMLSVADGRFSNETNADGYFMLAVPASSKNDTLALTAINYLSARVPLTTLARPDLVIKLTSALRPPPMSATDAYFSTEPSFMARDTVLKAVASIAKNYAGKPTLLRGFYRETISEPLTNQAILYAEGLIELYKPSYYFTKKYDKIHYLKGRRLPLAIYNIPVITSGPSVSATLDIVKYQEFLFRNRKVNKEYVFMLTGQTIIGDQPVYIIGFKPRDAYTSTGYFTGNLFVATGSLAIVRAEYELTEQGLTLVNRSRYMQQYKITLQKRIYRTDYTQFDNRWSFQSGSVENTFTHFPADNPYSSRADLVITSRQSDEVKPFRLLERADYTKLPIQAFDKTGPTFWKDESYLEPIRPLPQLIANPHNP